MVHNFWYKHLTCVHSVWTKCMQNIINHPKLAPSIMLEGITYMLPKKPDAHSPSDFKPVAHLQNIYRLLTAVISDKVYVHCELNNILTDKQKVWSKRVHTQAQWCVLDFSPTNSLEPRSAIRLEALLPMRPGTSSWEGTLSLVLGQDHADAPPRHAKLSGHCIVGQTCQACQNHRHHRSTSQKHPADLYNQDLKV